MVHWLCSAYSCARAYVSIARSGSVYESSRWSTDKVKPRLRARGAPLLLLPTRGRESALPCSARLVLSTAHTHVNALHATLRTQTNAFCWHTTVSLRRGASTTPSPRGATPGAPRRRRGGIRSRAVYDHVTRTPDVRYTASTRSNPHRSRRRRGATPTPRASSSSKH